MTLREFRRQTLSNFRVNRAKILNGPARTKYPVRFFCRLKILPVLYERSLSYDCDEKSVITLQQQLMTISTTILPLKSIVCSSKLHYNFYNINGR